MQDLNQDSPPTVPQQREAIAPVRKGMPVVIALVVIVALIGIANISSLVSGKKKAASQSTLTMRPASANPQQVSSFETQQQLQARRDADERQRQQEIAAAIEKLQAAQDAPGTESAGTPPMTTAQRPTLFGDSPNAPQQTSNMSQAQAEAKQREIERERRRQDALNSDTVAIDFSHPTAATKPIATTAMGERQESSPKATLDAMPTESAGNDNRAKQSPVQPASSVSRHAERNSDPMAPYAFDTYEGRLYRVFEGTVLEGVVTNHIEGGLTGPILIMLTTDYYSHDHQQLLMPQGTRLIGTVQSVGSAQQRKMFVAFHRAICPDGFSLELDRYVGLDPLGTTGLASKVDHGYLQAFAAAASLGALGGLAQIGNNGGILSPSTELRNGVSEQSAEEGEQVLNHFLNRLPVITLKEGSRARVYIGTDIYLPSYREHRVDPTI